MRNPLFFVALAFVLAGCSEPTVSLLNVQRPAKITVDPKLTKLFLDPATLGTTADHLKISSRLLLELKTKLESQGRFQLILGPVSGVDPNLEPVGVIQGSITSRKEEETGQRTEIATCQGGISGFAAGVNAAQNSKQGVTFGRGFLPCRSGSDIGSNALAAGVGMLTKLAGNEQADPLIQVVRVYKYKNFTFFAQADLTLTYLGQQRKTLIIRSDSANFSRQLTQPAVNAHTSILTWAEAMPLLISPVTPVMFRRIGVVDSSNPASPTGAWYKDRTLVREDMSAAQKREVISGLINKAVQPFVESVSPYTEEIEAEIALGGDSGAVSLMQKGLWKKARAKLQRISNKSGSDLYNLGLTFEAKASSDGDYVQAKTYYQQALSQEENLIFAQGIGRMERRLAEARSLKEQTKG